MSVPRRAGRRALLSRSVALPMVALAVGALVLAGCSSTDDGSGGSGASGAAGGDPSPGVTATSVKVGFVIADRGSLGQSLGFKTVDPGPAATREAAIRGIVNAINVNGGVGGRTIEPVFRVYQSRDDSPENAEALCRAFTQDEQVFAVYLDGQLQNNVRPCYRQGRTIMLDGSALGQDQQEFQEYGGYLWSPTLPEYGSFFRTQLNTLQQLGYFNGNTGVQLMTADDAVSRRVSETIAKPLLQSYGVTNIIENFIDDTNQGTLGSTISSAIVAGTGAGINRVIAVGGARIAPVALADVAVNDYNANWGISTYDNPTFLQNNPESLVTQRFVGMQGIGYDPTLDVDDQQLAFPDPANPQQVLCKQIVDAAGASPPPGAKVNYNSILKTCDAIFFLKAVLDRAPKDLTVQAFTNAAFTVGDAYRSSLSFGSFSGANTYAPTNAVRPLQWDATRNAFVYTGGVIPIQTQ